MEMGRDIFLIYPAAMAMGYIPLLWQLTSYLTMLWCSHSTFCAIFHFWTMSCSHLVSTISLHKCMCNKCNTVGIVDFKISIDLFDVVFTLLLITWAIRICLIYSYQSRYVQTCTFKKLTCNRQTSSTSGLCLGWVRNV